MNWKFCQKFRKHWVSDLSDFSSKEFFKDKSFWTLLPPNERSSKSVPLNFHLSGVFFEKINNEGVIRISESNSILILEHDTFNTITSTQNGGCVLFNPGHSIYQTNICARNVYSRTKANYCLVNLSQSSKSINFVSIISITECTTQPGTSDVTWLGGGKTSLSYYNSTSNVFMSTTGFYFGFSYGNANASFANVLSCNSTFNSVVFSHSVCEIKYSNFYKDIIMNNSYSFFSFDKSNTLVDHCVFSENKAEHFWTNKLYSDLVRLTETRLVQYLLICLIQDHINSLLIQIATMDKSMIA